MGGHGRVRTPRAAGPRQPRAALPGRVGAAVRPSRRGRPRRAGGGPCPAFVGGRRRSRRPRSPGRCAAGAPC